MRVKLAVRPPVLPMLAKRVEAIPQTGEWIFEPKWDGFRVLVFREGGTRYCCRAATRNR
jgi:ATP-dependent DNA ligase